MQGLDTTTPAGKALFQMMGVFAEFERSMIQERPTADVLTKLVNLWPESGLDELMPWDRRRAICRSRPAKQGKPSSLHPHR
jgi:Resolvase, N terminal domain